MARRVVTFHVEVTVDEDAIRAVEDDTPHAWQHLLGTLAAATGSICDDNLADVLDPNVKVVTGPTRTEYRR